jgi:integrase
LLNRARIRAQYCPDSVWVFAHKSGERIQFMQNGFQAACGRAGIKDFRVHNMRHTCASWLVQGGVPLLEVSKRLGHSTIEMAERYAHLAPENLKATVGVLAQLRFGYATGTEAVRAIG